MFVIPYRIGGPMDLDRLLTELPIQDFQKLIVAGGDGTVNHVVNAMVRNDIRIPLAIFPTGTANDLAGHLGVPLNIPGMIQAALSEDYIEVDVGKAGSKYFANVLAIGMLVDISQRTDPMIKNTLGLGAYYLRSLAEIPFARAFRLRISSEECTLDEEVSIVLVMNGRSAGGFKAVAPFSEIGDGLLDVIVVRKLILPVMLPALLSVMTGHHINDKRFECFRTAHLHIESFGDAAVSTDVDGERGDLLPLDIEVLPGRLLVNTYNREEFNPLS
jgi:YegS/Rv2252/BmrU family lipid kinase